LSNDKDDKSSIILKGDRESNSYKSLEISFTKCSGKHCKSPAELDDFLAQNYLQLPILSQHIDHQNMEEPIQTSLDESQAYSLSRLR